MPCMSPGWEHISPEEVEEKKFLEAALCALLKNHYDNGDYKKINFKEAGFNIHRLEDWWAKHKEKDRKRKEREAAAKREKKLRKELINKMTDEELKALGLTRK